MRLRSALVTALVITSVVLAGCSGTQGDPATTNEQTPKITTDNDPEKGDQLVSITSVDASVVAEYNASKKADFSDLSEPRKEVFLEAYNCSCNVEQSVFSFHTKDRVEYVNYNDQWYFVRVTIV